jgi:hypothetical protein
MLEAFFELYGDGDVGEVLALGDGRQVFQAGKRLPAAQLFSISVPL